MPGCASWVKAALCICAPRPPAEPSSRSGRQVDFPGRAWGPPCARSGARTELGLVLRRPRERRLPRVCTWFDQVITCPWHLVPPCSAPGPSSLPRRGRPKLSRQICDLPAHLCSSRACTGLLAGRGQGRAPAGRVASLCRDHTAHWGLRARGLPGCARERPRCRQSSCLPCLPEQRPGHSWRVPTGPAPCGGVSERRGRGVGPAAPLWALVLAGRRQVLSWGVGPLELRDASPLA